MAIFSAEKETSLHFLRKWTKDPRCTGDLRDIVDWNYYIERVGGTMRKIITIPAAMQVIFYLFIYLFIFFGFLIISHFIFIFYLLTFRVLLTLFPVLLTLIGWSEKYKE